MKHLVSDVAMLRTLQTAGPAPMPSPPAKCRQCSMVFPAPGFFFSNSTNITLKGTSGSPCPYCGGFYDILDGVYDFVGDAITLLSGPDATLQVLRRAAIIVRDSQAAGESPEKTVERVAEILPGFERAKGYARSFAVGVALWALQYAAGKMADVHVDPLMGKDAPPPVEISAVIKDAVEQAMKARDDAALHAGIAQRRLEKSPTVTSGLAGKVNPTGPQFPKSIAKLQSDLNKRYAQERLNRMPKRPKNVMSKQKNSTDRQDDSDQ